MEPFLPMPMIVANALQRLRNVPESFVARGIQLKHLQELEEALTIIQLDAEQNHDPELPDLLKKLESVLKDMDSYLRRAAGVGSKVWRVISSSTPLAILVGRILDSKIKDFNRRLDVSSLALKAKCSNFTERRGRLAMEYLEQTSRETFSFKSGSNMKRCFAWCSLFPKDYEFHGVELVQFWMANGLLPSFGMVEDPESIGMQYLKTLRSILLFFKDVKEDDLDAKFKILRPVYDLALSLASDEYGLRNFTSGRCSSQHFSFVGPEACKEEDAIKLLRQSDAIHTFMFFNTMRPPYSKFLIEAFISRGEYTLQTLILKKSTFKELPRGIGNLKALRYLDLSGNAQLREIPNSICKLRTLQTLMLQDCAQVKESPRDIRLLVSLRMLTITTKQGFLPEHGIGNLYSLRYLAIIGCPNLQYLPQGIHFLTSLRTLVIRDCDKLIKLPRSVKYLGMLQTLVIANCKMLQLNTKAEMEGNEDGLQDYLIGSGLSLHQLWIAKVEKLVAPPQWLIKRSAKTLRYLHIEDCPKLWNLPSWFQNLKSLEKLEILKCPSLFTSGGGEDKHEDHHINLNDGGRLQWLRIESLPQLVKLPRWLAGLSATTLVDLHIEDCPRLEILPKCWLQNQELLENLEILKCPLLLGGLGEQDEHGSHVNLDVYSSLGLSLSTTEDLNNPPLQLHRCLVGLSATALVNLRIEDCQSLTTTLQDHWLRNLTSLQNLAILRCPSVSFFQESHQEDHQHESGCLVRLWIESSPKLVELPRWLAGLSATTLVHLHIEDCQSLTRFPVELLQNLTSLENLEILRCPSLELWDANEETNTKLQVLEQEISSSGTTIRRLRRLWIVSSPKWLESPLCVWFVRLFGTTLLFLRIEDCPSLKALPQWIQNINSLDTLEIIRCPVLSYVPKKMRDLTALHVKQCPLLNPSYFQFSFFGRGYPKVLIYIDGNRYGN